MGYEILAAFVGVVLLPLVLLGFIAFWAMTARERRAIEDGWETYAARRQREYVPARGEWPNRTSPSVRWKANDVRYELSVVGVEGNARTRLVAWPHESLLGRFVIGSKNRVKNDGAKDLDDAFFQAAFAVSERPAGIAARALDAAARKALLGFWQRDDIVLGYRRGKLILEWPGRESNEARIDEAERVLGELARSVDEAFRRGITEDRDPSAGTRARTSS